MQSYNSKYNLDIMDKYLHSANIFLFHFQCSLFIRTVIIILLLYYDLFLYQLKNYNIIYLYNIVTTDNESKFKHRCLKIVKDQTLDSKS